jgi:hypothetical protein
MGIRREGLGIWALGVFVVIAATGFVLYAPIQIGLLLVGVLVALTTRRRSIVLVMVVALVPTLSLLRRLVAGEAAYQESDPLILLPLVLTAGVVVASWTRERTDKARDGMRFLAVATVIGVAIAVVLRAALSVNGLFYAGLLIVPMLLAVVVSTGRLPDVWPVVVRFLPWLAIAAGIYGIFQFFVLPSWDRSWMISSQLTSIGAPYPQQVRVFGASESPGPYAVFMGLSLTITLGLAVLAKAPAKKLGWLIASAVISFPLLLSGVRSAILGVVVAVALLAITRAKGFARIALVAFLIGGYQALTIVIGRFGAQSSILTADRYSDFSNDTSLLQRLTLLQYLANPFQFIVGNPAAPAVDNLYIDVLVRYGLLPAAALFALFIGVAVRAFKLLRRHQNETAALCVWFLLTQSMFGNIFYSLIGLLVGIILGSVMSTIPLDRSRPDPALTGVRKAHTAMLAS